MSHSNYQQQQATLAGQHHSYVMSDVLSKF